MWEESAFSSFDEMRQKSDSLNQWVELTLRFVSVYTCPSLQCDDIWNVRTWMQFVTVLRLWRRSRGTTTSFYCTHISLDLRCGVSSNNLRIRTYCYEFSFRSCNRKLQNSLLFYSL